MRPISSALSSTARCRARITKWQNTVTNLEQVISSNGAQPINPANDPVVQGLTTQLNRAEGRSPGLQRVAVPALRRLRRPQGLRPARRGQQAALPGGREPDHDAHQRDQHPGADAAEQQRRGAADQAAASEGRAAQRPGPARRGARRGKLAAEQLPGHQLRHERAADPAGGARPAHCEGRLAQPGAMAVVPAIPGDRDPAGVGQADAAARLVRADPPGGGPAPAPPGQVDPAQQCGGDAPAGRSRGAIGTGPPAVRPGLRIRLGPVRQGHGQRRACPALPADRDPVHAAARARLRLERSAARARARRCRSMSPGPTGSRRSCATWRTPGRVPTWATVSAARSPTLTRRAALTRNGTPASSAGGTRSDM